MNHLPLLIISALLAAQDPAPAQTLPTTPAPTAAAAQETRSSLLIDPKMRAQDYTQAFELLRREKPTLKINIQTSSGLIGNVSELTVSDNGTLLMLKVPFSQGTKYQIVAIEDIKEISYSP